MSPPPAASGFRPTTGGVTGALTGTAAQIRVRAPRLAPGVPRRAGRLLAAALLVGTIVTACSDSSPERGGGRLEVSGSATVERVGGKVDAVDDSDGAVDVHPGDRIRVSEGTAALRMRGGSTLELRAGLGDTDDSTLLVAETPRLEAGAVLVSTPGSVSLEAAGTSVHVGTGAATVTRTLGVAVATYEGITRIDSAGQERDVPALRELLVPALGRPPRTPLPLTYTASDPWDRRYLGAAMEFGEQLEARARGFTANLAAGEGTTAAFYRSVLPGLAGEPAFTQELLDPARPPGETLIGAAIADLSVRGSFAQRWAATFAFRDEGAAWGLVALDQGVNRAPLLESVELAFDASPLPFAESAPSPTPPTTAPVQPTTTVAPTTTTPPASPTTLGEPETPPPTPPPTEPEPPVDITPVIDPVIEPVGGLLSDLLDTLIGPQGSILGP